MFSLLPLALGRYQFFDRYALQINDSVKIGQDKGISITEGVKSAKDTLFYLTRDDSEEEKVRQKPPTKANGNASPVKNKTAGGKVLRNKTRGTQEEAMQSTSAKIAEHQKELHNQLQEQGLTRYSEEGDGANGKEGKAWKKFQSYKGEAGLPKEVETLRVRQDFLTYATTLTPIRFSWTAKYKRSSYLSMGLQFRST